MSNQENSSHFFSGPNRAEAKVRELASMVDENTVLLDYIKSEDAVRYSLGSDKFIKGSILTIYFADKSSISCRSVVLTKKGLIVKNIDDEDGILLKGSFYTIDISEINDRVALNALDVAFRSDNIPCTNAPSPKNSVPLAAAKGQIGIGGYLAFNYLYSPATYFAKRADGTINDTNSFVLISNTDVEGYWLDDTVAYSPHAIKDLSVVVSPTIAT